MAACGGKSDPPRAGCMLFTDLGMSGSSLISTLMLLVSITLFTTSLLASQLFSLFSLFDAGRSLFAAGDVADVALLVLLALSVVVLSLKLLFTIFDELLLVLLAAIVDFPLPSPLLFDSLSSAENENTLAPCD